MTRKRNFFAGPSTMPVEVLQTLQETIADFHDGGISIIETSHRSAMYDEIHTGAIDLVRELLSVPDNFDILLLGGGATLQFAMVPMNLLPADGSSDYVISGAWAKKALVDAKKVGAADVIYDGADAGYSTLPDTIQTGAGSAYVHITSNETIDGLQWPTLPHSGDIPLVVDMSSDIMSRPVDFTNIGLVYAGAQKNLGPAGVTLVIVRKDLVEQSQSDLPAYLSYKTHAEKGSLYNTPPVFSIYALNLVLDYVKRHGGVAAAADRSIARSSLIYDVVDGSDEFYTSKIDAKKRSLMNIVFTLANDELEKEFLQQAEKAGMLGLKGHRSVGGCRASLYNSAPVEWASELAELMKDFAAKNR